MKILNTNENALEICITRFAEMDDGRFHAETNLDVHLRGHKIFRDSVREMSVFINPRQEQLEEIVEALNDGRLRWDTLDQEDFGGLRGGFSILNIRKKVEPNTIDQVGEKVNGVEEDANKDIPGFTR